MEGFVRRVTVMVMVAVVLMMMGWQTGVVARLITVGGSHGWTQNVNYTKWSTIQHPYVGDWLYFVFDKHSYNVLEVNKTSYENCNDKDFIRNITNGGRDVFQLTQVKPYYFLSSGAYCFNGMRVAVCVEEETSATSLTPANGSPPHAINPLILPTTFVLAITLLKPAVD